MARRCSGTASAPDPAGQQPDAAQHRTREQTGRLIADAIAGAGTTQTALAARTPSVPEPHFAHQCFRAARVYGLGAAARPVKRQRLTAKRPAVRIARTLSDTALSDRAAWLGAPLRHEDGLAVAVERIGRNAASS